MRGEPASRTSTLSRLESGKRQATLELLLPLTRQLGIGLDDLVTPTVPDPRVRRPVIRQDGLVIAPLAPEGSPIATYKITYPPTGAPPEPRVHDGYEIVTFPTPSWSAGLHARQRQHGPDVQAGRMLDRCGGPYPGEIDLVAGSVMIPLLSSGLPSRGRAPARWAVVAVALVLVGGCTGGRPTPPAGSPSTGGAPSSSAAAGLAGLKVATAEEMVGYNRDAGFGDWADLDGDCQDTRQEILARDLDQVTLSPNGCTVASGVLHDPYTGARIDFTRGVATSADVQIDHVVAAGNAWVSGARRLSQPKREQFYNDPLNLLAVDGPTNGAKSDSPADRWLPPNTGFRCTYVATQIAVKAKYHLTVTPAEKAAMTTVLADCPDQPLPTGDPSTSPTGDPSTSRDGTPTDSAPTDSAPTDSAPTDSAPAGGFANCTQARAAGAAPLHSGSPGYNPRLDRDGDGVACEG